MSYKKAILSLLLAAALMVSGFSGVIYADDSDEDAVTYYEDLIPGASDGTPAVEDFSHAINVLKALGIIDSRLSSNDILTKGQLAQGIIKAMNVEMNLKNIESHRIFSDIAPGSDEGAAIMACYSLGLMHGNGDGTFRPEDKVTYQMAVKVIVSMLGYGVTVSDPSNMFGYYDIANSKKITSGIKRDFAEEVSGALVSRMIYNALEVEMLEMTAGGMYAQYSSIKGDTILSKHSIVKYKNILMETNITALSGAGTLKPGTVRIGGIKCEVNGTNAESYLGQEVDAYAKVDKNGNDTPKIIYIQPTNRNTIVNIETGGWISVKGNSDNTKKIEYYDDDKKFSLTVSKEADTLYQNVAAPDFDLTRYSPENAVITAIDNNGDDFFDVVSVREYTTGVVTSKGAATYSLVCDNNCTVYLDPNSTDYTFDIYKNGVKIDFEGIAVNNVISVTESAAVNGKVYKQVMVSDKKLVGTVSMTENDGKLKYAMIGINRARVLPEVENRLNIGSEGTFLLDFMDNIAGYTASSAANMYGYVIGVSSETGLDSSAALIMLTQDSNVKEIKTKGTITFDGEAKVKGSSLMPGGPHYNKINHEMIMFKTDSQGVIVEILSKYNEKQDSEAGLSLYKKAGVTDDAGFGTTLVLRQYNPNVPLLFVGSFAEIKSYPISNKEIKSSMVVGKDDTIALDPSALVFVAPISDLDGEYSDYSKYKVTNKSYFSSSTNYYTEVFNYSDKRYSAGLILVRSDGSPEIPVGTNPVMVSNIKLELGDDGLMVYTLEVLDKSGSKPLRVSNDILQRVDESGATPPDKNDISPKQLNKGDIIKYTLVDGEISKIERVVDYKNIDSVFDVQHSSGNSNYRAEHTITTGRVVRVDGNIVTVSVVINYEWRLRQYNMQPVPNICIYDPAGKGRFFTGTVSDLEPGSIVTLRSSDGYVTSVYGYLQY